jgi:hypothetical protein
MMLAVDPQLELGFQFVQDLAKQLITLSTGVLALSITFTKDIVREVPHGAVKWLKSAWALLLGSILAGICELSALAGALVPPGGISSAIKEVPGSARMFGGMQLLTFAGAILCVILYGFSALQHQKQNAVAVDRIGGSVADADVR